MNPELPPIHRTLSVTWSQADAFQRFTRDFASWWPWRAHSIGGARIKALVFECRVGGLIYEEHLDGRRFRWGEILEFDPPRQVKFTWHPLRDIATAQDVLVRFTPEPGGTRVELISDKWENWGEGAERGRKGYDMGWGYVLNVWAGRKTAGMRVLDGIIPVIRLVEWVRGGSQGTIERSKGEMARVG